MSAKSEERRTVKEESGDRASDGLAILFCDHWFKAKKLNLVTVFYNWLIQENIGHLWSMVALSWWIETAGSENDRYDMT